MSYHGFGLDIFSWLASAVTTITGLQDSWTEEAHQCFVDALPTQPPTISPPLQDPSFMLSMDHMPIAGDETAVREIITASTYVPPGWPYRSAIQAAFARQ